MCGDQANGQAGQWQSLGSHRGTNIAARRTWRWKIVAIVIGGAVAASSWTFGGSEGAFADDGAPKVATPKQGAENAIGAAEKLAGGVSDRPGDDAPAAKKAADGHSQGAGNGPRPGMGPGGGRGPGMGRGMGMGMGRMMSGGPGAGGPDANMRGDADVFHYLLEHHGEIRRTVKRLDNGVDTLTESDNPEVAEKLHTHAEQMHRRVKEGRGLRFFDELFVALFANYDRIKMQVEKTKLGVRVVETSDDPRIALLIQAHADVVSRFVDFGFDEMHKNHPVPEAAKPAPKAPATKESASKAPASKLVFPIIEKYGGVVARPNAVDQPKAGAKMVFDVTVDAKPTDVNKGLDRAARLLNLYGAAGLKASDLKLTIVLHGEATKSVLTDAAYCSRVEAESNPNLALIRELRKHGVEVLVCGQALHYKSIDDAEVSADVPIAAAALTVIGNRQTDGYSYVPVH